jgi:hypothetical protein
MAGQTAQVDPYVLNAQARALVLANSVDRIQSIYSSTTNAAQQTVVNIAPRNVGLIKGFFVDVIATVTNGATNVATLTPIGPANILSQIVFTDLQNNNRIQTTGWHIHFLNTAKAGRPFGIAQTYTNSPIAYGNNFVEIAAPATIAAATPGTVTMRYYVPLAYSQSDLRGALYAGVVNATMNLQLTINAAAFAATGADSVSAVYSGNTGTVGNVQINVYQHYLDQLPTTQQGPVLPMMDLQTFYDLKNTSVNSLTTVQDYPIPYANYRSFLSTYFIYDNGGTLNAGTDLNYIAMQSANFTQLFKLSPYELSLLSRIKHGADFPVGNYYIDHRSKPINTNQYGNMELVLNASVVNANAQVLVGYEAFGQTALMSQAGSLPAAG